MKPTKQQIQAAKNLFAARALTNVIEAKVYKIQVDILGAKMYSNANTDLCADAFIINPKRSYLLGETDFAEYLQLLHAEYTRAGFIVPFGYCPLLMAQSAEREAEKELIATMEPTTGATNRQLANHPEKRKEYIELTLRYLGPFCKVK